ncbi:hypothetical protein FZC78_08755 [Rossellomorea vietnamensis]|uniref:Uncharacterized protein n=2 Tax=Rossellomorea TaxID=2837508 RepID=A0A5D4NZ63_9BACI|nr:MULTISPECIES: hypothetical protein [Rossellomorea]TYS17922.1 hypothetical protein FZC78_08755 [Rossellomorea vietnamensis]TYS78384.1 hypothetical protein FZC80_11515 [Rossellomorea aquimaris]
MKYLLRYGLFLAGCGLSFYLYQHLLGAIPLLLLAFYFFYEAFSEIYANAMKQRHTELEKGETP